MAAYLDTRDGKTWRYAKMVRGQRISGTPSEVGLANSKLSAEHAEAQHVARILNPELAIKHEAKSRPTQPGGRFPTIREFAIRFLAEYDPTGANRSRKSRRSIVNGSIVPFLGHVRLDEIDQSHVNAFIATAGKSASTINNKLTTLSTLLKYAIDVLHGLTIPRLKLRVSRKASKKAAVAIRAIDRDRELPKLLRAVRGDQRFVVAILLASDAGLRIGEIRGLMWTDIAFKGDGAIHVRRSIDSENVQGPPKNGTERTISGLTHELRAALEALPKRGLWILTPLPRAHDARIATRFLGYKGMLSKIKRAYRDAGIEIATGDDVDPFHSLRHTYGSELSALGVPLRDIMALMGHADITTTQRYLSTTRDQLASAMRLLRDR